MATANLNDQREVVDTGNDSVVIINPIECVTGGRTLDTTGFTPEVIKAGHIVIKDAEGVRKPMPVTGDAYAALPADHSFDGVVVGTVATAKPMVSIMVRGTVNEKASPYPVTEAMKTALHLIRFTNH